MRATRALRRGSAGIVSCVRLALLLTLAWCAPVNKQPWPEERPANRVAPVPAGAAAETPVAPPVPPPRAERCAWSTDPVSMDLVRADVRAVLQALADRGGINVAIADAVGGQVTIRFEGVPIDEALAAVAVAAGLAIAADECVVVVRVP